MNKMAKKVRCLKFVYTFYNKSNLYKLEMKLYFVTYFQETSFKTSF